MLGSNFNRYELILDEYDNVNDKHIAVEDILSWLEVNKPFIKFYAFILHNKDQEIINGVTRDKYLHYHLVIELYNARKDKTILNDIVLHLRCNMNLVSIIPAYDWVTRVRYLTHLGNKDKFQYDAALVTTNNVFQYDEYIAGVDIDNMTILTLQELCIHCDSIREVYMRIGLKNARLYRSLINDLWEECGLKRFEYSKEKELPF